MVDVPGERFQEMLQDMATTCESLIYNIYSNKLEQAIRRAHKLQKDFETHLNSYRNEHTQTIGRLKKLFMQLTQKRLNCANK